MAGRRRRGLGPAPPPWRALTLANPAIKKWGYTTTSNMPKGHNTCKWLTLSSTGLCGKSCLTDFCIAHLVRLRKGSLTQPCRGCGEGLLTSNSSVVSAGIGLSGVVQQERHERNLRASPPSKFSFRDSGPKDIPTPFRDSGSKDIPTPSSI